MTDNRKIYIPLPAADSGGAQGKAQINAVAEAIAALKGDARAVFLHGNSALGTAMAASGAARGLSDGDFEYVFAFDCRGGVSTEEFLVRLCQFLSHNSVTDLKNIMLSPMPVALKLNSLVFFLKKIRLLLVLAYCDELLGDAPFAGHPLKDALSFLVSKCTEGSKFIIAACVGHPLGDATHTVSIKCDTPPPGPGMAVKAVEDTFDSSIPAVYGHLSEGARGLLMSCAAFGRSITASALEGASGFSESALGELVASGLIAADTGGGTLHIDPMTRKYLLGMLDSDKRKAALIRAADFHAAFGRREGVLWHMLYAHRLYLEAAEPDRAAAMVAVASEPLRQWGFTDLVRHLNTHAAEHSSGSNKASALGMLGMLCEDERHYEKAAGLYGQCIEISRAAGDERSCASALGQLGHVLGLMGRFDMALEKYGESIATLRALGETEGVATASHNMAAVLEALGRDADALDAYGESISAKEALGDERGAAASLFQSAMIMSRMGEPRKAIAILAQCTGMFESAGDNQLGARANLKLGELSLEVYDTDTAFAALGRSHDMAVTAGDKSVASHAKRLLGRTHIMQGGNEEALKCLTVALKLAEGAGDREVVAECLTDIGEFHMRNKDYKNAIRNLIMSLALFDAAKSGMKSLPLGKLEKIEEEVGPDLFKRYNDDVMEELRDRRN